MPSKPPTQKAFNSARRLHMNSSTRPVQSCPHRELSAWVRGREKVDGIAKLLERKEREGLVTELLIGF